MRSSMLAFCISVAALSCATPQKSVAPSPVGAAANKALAEKVSADTKRPMTCTYEMPLGSHIPERVCRYTDEVEAQRQETQDHFREHRAINTEPR